MAARILAVYQGGKLAGLQSSAAQIDFASVRIGASNLLISEVTGKFDFDGKILSNLGAAIANGQAVEFAQFNTALADYIPLTQKGANNGVASLDAGGKVPVSQLPNSIMEFQGQYDAGTNTPTLVDGTGNAGDVYRVNVAGAPDLGSGNINLNVGDWLMYNGTIWEKSSNSNDVVSVNGQQGVVVLDTDDVSEGSTNLYYTSSRFDSDFGSKTTSDLTEGSNLYYTEGRFDSSLSGKDSDDISEGSTNLYYTSSRFDSDFGAKNTDDLSEGSTNLYYTEGRFDSSLGGKSTDDVSEGSTNLYYTEARFDEAHLTKVSKALVNDNVAPLTLRQVVYIKPNGNIDLASASQNEVNAKMIGIVGQASIAAAASGSVIVGDGHIVSGFSGLTPGAFYYLDPTTSGAITATAPSASGQSIYQVGAAISATELEFMPRPIIELL